MRTIENIIAAKMEQRFSTDGIRQEDEEVLDDLLGLDTSRSDRSVKEAVARRFERGVPSGEYRTSRRATKVSPPITNRGVTKYQAELLAAEIPVLQRGGYDGGAEIGFEGIWDSEKFAPLKEQLQAAKEAASESGVQEMAVIGDKPVLVDPSGACAGLHYRYKVTIGGVVIFIHHNCPKGRQAVRVRYGATALIGRSIFDVHRAVLEFLASLGFLVTKEVISRIDLQVLVDVDPEDLVWLCFDDERVVRRSQNDVLYRNKKHARTFLIGQRGRLQLCIYDKDAELMKMSVSNPVKFQLMVDHCLGSDYSFGQPLTRVEFRLWRDVLRVLDINTIVDLRKLETSLAKWLTSQWFRILEDPKVRGHENTAKVHPVWRKIQDAFAQWFPGENGEVHDITLNRDKPIQCDSLSLRKQALGCLKTAFVLSSGLPHSVQGAYEMLCSWVGTVKKEFYDGLCERSLRLKARTGVSIEECSDWLASLTGGGRCYD